MMPIAPTLSLMEIGDRVWYPIARRRTVLVTVSKYGKKNNTFYTCRSEDILGRPAMLVPYEERGIGVWRVR